MQLDNSKVQWELNSHPSGCCCCQTEKSNEKTIIIKWTEMIPGNLPDRRWMIHPKDNENGRFNNKAVRW